jgi:hypothetical protein
MRPAANGLGVVAFASGDLPGGVLQDGGEGQRQGKRGDALARSSKMAPEVSEGRIA